MGSMERPPGDERYWIALSLVEGIGPILLRRLGEHFGALELAWHARQNELEAAGLDARLASVLARGPRDLQQADAVMARAERAGMTVLTLADPLYPQRLAATADPPPVLYAQGVLQPQDTWALAVVGTRRMSPYGREVTHRLSGDLARAGLT